MAKLLPNRVGSRLGWGDPTDKALLVLKAVDVTDECPKRQGGNRVILDYTEDRHGLIVIITDCDSEECVASRVHYHLMQLTEVGPQPATLQLVFSTFAENFGLTPQGLVDLIRLQAPRNNPRISVGDLRHRTALLTSHVPVLLVTHDGELLKLLGGRKLHAVRADPDLPEGAQESFKIYVVLDSPVEEEEF